MKRLFAVLLSIVIISGSCYAADIDLSGMSTDELISLRTAIVQELIDRGDLQTAAVPAGEYTVGTDIPVGSYTITTKEILVTITINDYDQMYVVSPDSSVGKVTLSEGDKFTCSSNIELQKYGGISFE